MTYSVSLIPAPGFASDCWLLADPASREAAVIDPSAPCEEIETALRQKCLTLRWILLTHGHFDHLLSLDALRSRSEAPAVIHTADAPLLADPIGNVSALFLHDNHMYRPAERTVQEGDALPLGAGTIRVLHTPGHTPGSVCYEADGVLFTGDTLFDCGMGRTDLPGGDDWAMRQSLARLAALPDHVRIFPGHGAASDMGTQKQNNPYLN